MHKYMHKYMQSNYTCRSICRVIIHAKKYVDSFTLKFLSAKNDFKLH